MGLSGEVHYKTVNEGCKKMGPPQKPSQTKWGKNQKGVKKNPPQKGISMVKGVDIEKGVK